MHKLLPLIILIWVVLGCGSRNNEPSPSATPTPKSERIVANNAVKDPNARFIGQSVAYLNNLKLADESMANTFVDGDLTKIAYSIKSAADTEKRDFATIERAPKAYRHIEKRLNKIHADHERAYIEYLNVITNPKPAQIDRANKTLKTSLLEMKETIQMLSGIMSGM